MSSRIKWTDYTIGSNYDAIEDAATDSSKEMLNAVFEAVPEVMELLIKQYNYGDKGFAHPVLHEIIQQSGIDYKTTGQERHKRQNEQLKWALQHPKFQLILLDNNYTDKYGNTAYERLAGSMLYMKDEDLAQWIRNSDFGKGKDFNKLLTTDNIEVHKDFYGGKSGKYSIKI